MIGPIIAYHINSNRCGVLVSAIKYDLCFSYLDEDKKLIELPITDYYYNEENKSFSLKWI
jgi:hypothetical protein